MNQGQTADAPVAIDGCSVAVMVAVGSVAQPVAAAECTVDLAAAAAAAADKEHFVARTVFEVDY